MAGGDRGALLLREAIEAFERGDARLERARALAELASQGLTNREIAQTLFITARAVEGHLTSVFRKLRLDSRTELAAALAEEIPVMA